MRRKPRKVKKKPGPADLLSPHTSELDLSDLSDLDLDDTADISLTEDKFSGKFKTIAPMNNMNCRFMCLGFILFNRERNSSFLLQKSIA